MTMNAEHEQIREALLHGSNVGIAEVNPETLFFVESELIEDHLEGSLSDTDSELFLTNFLVNEERRELVNEVRMLKRFSSDAFEFDASVFDEPSDDAPASAESTSKTATIVIISAITVILVAVSIQLLRS